MIIQQQSSSISSADESSDESNSSFNEISSMPNGMNINQRLIELLHTAFKCIQAREMQSATLHLEKIDRIMQYISKIEKQFDKSIRIVCYYNLAYIFQKQHDFDKCCNYMSRCVALMQTQVMAHQYQSVRKSTSLVQLILQYCAILSQSGDHQKALDTAQAGIIHFRKMFAKALKECKRIQQDSRNVDAKNQKILFSSYVIENAIEILSEFVEISTFNQIKHNMNEQFSATKQKIYFWKNNPENNQKFLRKELGFPQKQPQCRNLLGLQNTDNWIQTYNIGSIMHMSPIQYADFVESDNFVLQMSKKNLIKKIMLASVIYFSIATQLRFIEIDKITSDNNLKDNILKSEQYKISEIFHLKAIDIICKVVRQNSVFVNHLVSSYHKHYKQDLLVIEEQASMVEYSFLEPIVKKSKKSAEKHKKKNLNNNSITDKIIGYQPFKKKQIKDSLLYNQTKRSNQDFSSSNQLYQSLKSTLKGRDVSGKKTFSTIRLKEESRQKIKTIDTRDLNKSKSKSLNSKLERKFAVKKKTSSKMILIQDQQVLQELILPKKSKTPESNRDQGFKKNSKTGMLKISPSALKKKGAYQYSIEGLNFSQAKK